MNRDEEGDTFLAAIQLGLAVLYDDRPGWNPTSRSNPSPSAMQEFFGLVMDRIANAERPDFGSYVANWNPDAHARPPLPNAPEAVNDSRYSVDAAAYLLEGEMARSAAVREYVLAASAKAREDHSEFLRATGEAKEAAKRHGVPWGELLRRAVHPGSCLTENLRRAVDELERKAEVEKKEPRPS